MAVKHFKELVVWQKAMNLAEEAYRLTKTFPPEERFSLANQMQRAAVSIPSNIAEGQSRVSTGEFLHFLSIAKGSNAELETQLELSVRLRYITSSQATQAISLSAEVGRMLNSLISKLATSH